MKKDLKIQIPRNLVEVGNNVFTGILKQSSDAGSSINGYNFLDLNSYAYAWGLNTSGGLGDNTVTNASLPVSVVGGRQWLQICFGANTAALDLNSYAYCWGQNTLGGLGDNSQTARSSPVSVVGGRQFTAIGSGYTGSNTFTLALDSNSYAWAWGAGGILGDNTANSRSSPVSVVGGRQFIRIAAGSAQAVALDGNSYAWAWGTSGGNGTMGDNSLTSRSSPVSVVGGRQFIQVSSSLNASCALDGNSYVWAWGAGGSGNLGDNTTLTRSSPVSVVGGLQFSRIAAGYTNVYGLTSAGEMWAWGANGNGQIGDGTTIARSSPVSVATSLRWNSFAVVGSAVYAIDTTGTLYVWGQNQSNCTLGLGWTGDTTNKSSPTSVIQVKPRALWIAQSVMGK